MGGEHLNIVAGTGPAPQVTLVDRIRTDQTALVDFSGGGSVIPFNDTIPTGAAGQVVAQVTITPKAIGNKFKIRSQMFVGVEPSERFITAAIFVSSQANALAAMVAQIEFGKVGPLAVDAEFTATDTVPITFDLRVGVSSAVNTAVVNGDPLTDTRRYGGVAGTFLEVEEYA